MSEPLGRESHFVTISKSLTRANRLEIPHNRLVINVPPGHGKSTMLCMWVAWSMTQFPDSRFLYISYSKSLASKHTEFIRRIMTSKHYEYLFDVRVRKDSHAKDFFQTEQGGTVGAYGSTGSITGQDAGLPGLDRFSGAVIIDDPHKPDEVHSETIRASVISNYRETIQQRARGQNVPFVFIGQRLHEDDLAAFLINGKDGYDWDKVILESLDGKGNALFPEVFPLDMLLNKKKCDQYVFSSQFQQEPLPSGGSLFKEEWFVETDDYPNILKTFITADTAETDKSYNDATVFSFWGVYEIEIAGRKTGKIGLHWIDCEEIRIEPKDLRGAFDVFMASCMQFKVTPYMAAIEKKSTGVTLLSSLQDLRGIEIRDIKRDRSSGSKTQRFLQIQHYIASKLLSINSNSRHKNTAINHMCKITANNTHRFDDIADTVADAVYMTYVSKQINIENIGNSSNISHNIALSVNQRMRARSFNHATHS